MHTYTVPLYVYIYIYVYIYMYYIYMCMCIYPLHIAFHSWFRIKTSSPRAAQPRRGERQVRGRPDRSSGQVVYKERCVYCILVDTYIMTWTLHVDICGSEMV